MTPEQLTGLTNTHLMPLMVGNKSFLVHPQVHNDLRRLLDAAGQAGFCCYIASGFRDFERQQSIWDRKFSGELPVLDDASQPLDINRLSEEQRMYAILRWSALPGASRHHWGTDFDVYCARSLGEKTLKQEPWEYQTGHQAEFSTWLQDNMGQFGFFLPYRNDLGGVNIEPWHISHRATATSCLKQLNLPILRDILLNHPILGANTVQTHLNTIYNRYILAITQ